MYEELSVGGLELIFVSFLHLFDKKNGHNMLVLMLDPRCKKMYLVSIFLGCETTTTLIAKCDEQLLLPLFLEVYKLLMPNKILNHNEFIFIMDSQYHF